MDKYKKFFGQTWCATGDVRRVDEKIVTAIRRVTGLGDSVLRAVRIRRDFTVSSMRSAAPLGIGSRRLSTPRGR